MKWGLGARAKWSRMEFHKLQRKCIEHKNFKNFEKRKKKVKTPCSERGD